MYAEQTITADSQYMHFVSEVAEGSGIDLLLEPDTLILTRVFRDALHENDTFPDSVTVFQIDAHYRADRYATINRAPDFYNVA